jgi:hypothetical protein
MHAEHHLLAARVNVSAAVSQLPVLRCRLIAGFGCPPRLVEQVNVVANVALVEELIKLLVVDPV